MWISRDPESSINLLPHTVEWLNVPPFLYKSEAGYLCNLTVTPAALGSLTYINVIALVRSISVMPLSITKVSRRI